MTDNILDEDKRLTTISFYVSRLTSSARRLNQHAVTQRVGMARFARRSPHYHLCNPRVHEVIRNRHEIFSAQTECRQFSTDVVRYWSLPASPSSPAILDIASITNWICSVKSTPRSAAPFWMSSRLTFAAKLFCFIFFFTLFAFMP